MYMPGSFRPRCGQMVAGFRYPRALAARCGLLALAKDIEDVFGEVACCGLA